MGCSSSKATGEKRPAGGGADTTGPFRPANADLGLGYDPNDSGPIRPSQDVHRQPANGNGADDVNDISMNPTEPFADSVPIHSAGASRQASRTKRSSKTRRGGNNGSGGGDADGSPTAHSPHNKSSRGGPSPPAAALAGTQASTFSAASGGSPQQQRRVDQQSAGGSGDQSAASGTSVRARRRGDGENGGGSTRTPRLSRTNRGNGNTAAMGSSSSAAEPRSPVGPDGYSAASAAPNNAKNSNSNTYNNGNNTSNDNDDDAPILSSIVPKPTSSNHLSAHPTGGGGDVRNASRSFRPDEDVRSFIDDFDDADMVSAVEGDDLPDAHDLDEMDGGGGGGHADLAQTVTIFHAGIEIDVITGMLREGGEIVFHRPRGGEGGALFGGGPSSVFHGRSRSVVSAKGGTHNGDAFDSDEEDEEWEEEEEDEEYEDSYDSETVSVASNSSGGGGDAVVATGSAYFGPLGTGEGGAGGANSLKQADSQATFRFVKRNRAPSVVGTVGSDGSSSLPRGRDSAGGLPPAGPSRAAAANNHQQQQKAATAARGSDGLAPSGSNAFINIEENSEPTSTAGKIISQRLTQQGKFDLSQLRPGVDMLAANPKVSPVAVAYKPTSDPRLATGEYETIALKATQDDPQLLSSSATAASAPPPAAFGNFNVSMNAAMIAAQLQASKDYGKGRSSALPPMDISSSWDLLKSIPNAIETLNAGGVLYRFQQKSWSELTLSERIEMGSFINLSQFKDEDVENDQPVIDFVNNKFASPAHDLSKATVICARVLVLLPKVKSKDLNIDVICSKDYQTALLASGEKLEETDRERTTRKYRSIGLGMSIRVQMSGSERADEEELARHVHHHDCRPDRLIIMERTKKNRSVDSTMKSKAFTMLYDIPPAGWTHGKPPSMGALAASSSQQLGGGVLQSITNVTIRTSLPRGMGFVMDKAGSSLSADCAKTVPSERVFLVKKKEEGWALMAHGGDFPQFPLPWSPQ